MPGDQKARSTNQAILLTEFNKESKNGPHQKQQQQQLKNKEVSVSPIPFPRHFMTKSRSKRWDHIPKIPEVGDSRDHNGALLV